MDSISNICLAAEMVKEGEKAVVQCKNFQQKRIFQIISSAVSLIRHHPDLLDPAIKIQVARPSSCMVFYDFIIIRLEYLLATSKINCYLLVMRFSF